MIILDDESTNEIHSFARGSTFSWLRTNSKLLLRSVHVLHIMWQPPRPPQCTIYGPVECQTRTDRILSTWLWPVCSSILIFNRRSLPSLHRRLGRQNGETREWACAWRCKSCYPELSFLAPKCRNVEFRIWRRARLATANLISRTSRELSANRSG